MIVGVAIGTSIAPLSFLALILLLMIWRDKRKRSAQILNIALGCKGIIAFRYIDLQRATKIFFSEVGGEVILVLYSRDFLMTQLP